MKTLLAATFTALAIMPIAHGAIAVFVAQDISIPNTFEGVYLDLETGTTETAPFSDADLNFFFGGSGISNDAGSVVATAQFLRSDTGFLDMALNVPVGSTIGPDPTVFSVNTANFSTDFGASGSPNGHLGTDSGQFEPGERGFLGFSLELDSGPTAYGVMEVTFTPNADGGTIHGWQYDDSGAAVNVVPEPSMGLLLLLGMGLCLRRRK